MAIFAILRHILSFYSNQKTTCASSISAVRENRSPRNHHRFLADTNTLKNHFDEDVDLSKIYRYLDKLSDHQHEIVQDISVRHTAKLFGGNIGVLFYDVTTLYFEADYEDDLRKTGFSKEGRHSNPQIILGLLVSLGGYPLVYCIRR